MPCRFQFSLRALLYLTLAACLVAQVWRMFVRTEAPGKISDLPIAERKALLTIASQGIAVSDRFT